MITVIICSCNNQSDSPHGNIGTAQDLQKQIMESEEGRSFEFPEPHADIPELEGEVNNGGFNQYFFNSSGQNCFETLDSLATYQDEYYLELGELLRQAIEVVNTENLSKKELIDKIRNRELESLQKDSINHILDSLDNVYYGH